MKFSVASLAALPLLAAAAPAPPVDPPTPSLPFTVKAWQPRPHKVGNDKRIIDFTNVPTIEAHGRHFFTQKSGGSPSTYCPEQVGDACPPGNETVLIGTSGLNTLVPGGQQLYVEPNGAVGFTQAHSVAYPPGSNFGGFTYSPGQQVSYWGYEGFGAKDFMACPPNKTTVPTVPPTEPEGRRRAFGTRDEGEDNGWPADTYFQIFANFANATVPSGDVADCFDFQAVVIDWTQEGAAAWQYV
ncbi:hypothetical protein FQN54_001143 [Arachnomyces sp. PD_36]|nr:hypothetical protein FQN54_001143 [Arachnomyces sp. PD_36]